MTKAKKEITSEISAHADGILAPWLPTLDGVAGPPIDMVHASAKKPYRVQVCNVAMITIQGKQTQN